MCVCVYVFNQKIRMGLRIKCGKLHKVVDETNMNFFLLTFLSFLMPFFLLCHVFIISPIISFPEVRKQ